MLSEDWHFPVTKQKTGCPSDSAEIIPSRAASAGKEDDQRREGACDEPCGTAHPCKDAVLPIATGSHDPFVNLPRTSTFWLPSQEL